MQLPPAHSPRSSQCLYRSDRGVQWACDRYHSAPFTSLTVALTFAISPTNVILLSVYHVCRDEKFQEPPLCPSYHNGPYSMGQRANVEILTVAYYTFRNWGKNHGIVQLAKWAHCELNLGSDFICLLTTENFHLTDELQWIV